MSTWAVTMVRDEADIVEASVRHMADEVDGLIVADNLSKDGTRSILDSLAAPGELPVPLIVLDDPDPAYHQSDKMSFLGRAAAEQGAEWVVAWDIDELWLTEDGRVADMLERCDASVVHARLYNHFASAIDPEGATPFDRMVWRQPEAAPLPKVAIRWQPGAQIHQGNHGATLPRPGPVAGGLEIRHFPYRSPEQFIRKARNGAEAYRATNLPEHVGAHWRSYGQILEQHGEKALLDVYHRYFCFLSPSDEGLTPDPAPFMRWRRVYAWQRTST